MDLLQLTESGLYCEAGDFYIDPWKGVNKALLTHAHSDHARLGSQHYLCAAEGFHVTRARLGNSISLQQLDYGQSIQINGVHVSFFPAGHILGSAQIRVEYKGEVWVASGDYKTEADANSCKPFEPVACHTFITESTFGLPVYQWQPQQQIFNEINAWWKKNSSEGRASLLMAYGLGKSQRILAGVDASIGPIYIHGSVAKMNEAYLQTGYHLPQTQLVTEEKDKKTDYSKALIIAPPSAEGTAWAKRFGDYSNAFASGWMAIRGMRRRSSLDKGFVLSDHADWNGLLQAIKDTGCERVIVTHGYTQVLARYLTELGYRAEVMKTHFEGEVINTKQVTE